MEQTDPRELLKNIVQIFEQLKWFKKSGSNRHLEDAESVIKIPGKDLDSGYLKEWAKKLGVMNEFEKLIP